MNVLLIPLSVIFTLSLVGSIVLFRFLKSSATIKKRTYQAGGAIAGFILIYGLLYTSFNSWYKNEIEEKWKSEQWTIKGTVLMRDDCKHEGIAVRHIPDAPSAESRSNGEFRMEGVEIFPGKLPNGLPALEFDSGRDEFHGIILELNKDNVEINREKKQVILKNEITLEKIKNGGE
jgi:hypothetical protein